MTDTKTSAVDKLSTQVATSLRKKIGNAVTLGEGTALLASLEKHPITAVQYALNLYLSDPKTYDSWKEALINCFREDLSDNRLGGVLVDMLPSLAQDFKDGKAFTNDRILYHEFVQQLVYACTYTMGATAAQGWRKGQEPSSEILNFLKNYNKVQKITPEITGMVYSRLVHVLMLAADPEQAKKMSDPEGRRKLFMDTVASLVLQLPFAMENDKAGGSRVIADILFITNESPGSPGPKSLGLSDVDMGIVNKLYNDTATHAPHFMLEAISRHKFHANMVGKVLDIVSKLLKSCEEKFPDKIAEVMPRLEKAFGNLDGVDADLPANKRPANVLKRLKKRYATAEAK
ncbi:MAG: hypothetical protein AB7G06_05455 [Bdellovibrionales bacterium]